MHQAGGELIAAAGTADSRYFVDTDCPLCGGNAALRILPIDSAYASAVSGIALQPGRVGISKCRRCSHEYVSPQPTREFLDRFYESYLTDAKERFYADRAAEEIPEHFAERYGRHLDVIRGAVPPGSRLLDVGCGMGMFLRLARRDAGFEVEGCEPNREACHALQDVHGIKAFPVFVEDLDALGTYDVITAWDVLEHTAHPVQVMRRFRDLLRVGGLLVVEVPCRDSFVHQLARVLFTLSGGAIKRPLNLIYGLHHLQYFDSGGLKHLVEATGFKATKVLRTATPVSQIVKARTRGLNIRNAVATMYNIGMRTTFSLARLLGRQNKLVVYAKGET